MMTRALLAAVVVFGNASCKSTTCSTGDAECWLKSLTVSEDGKTLTLVDVDADKLTAARSAMTGGDAWAVGAGSVLLHWNGTALTIGESGGFSPLHGLSNGWAVGTNGELAHFDGTAWKRVTSGTFFNLRDVAYPWAVGGGGTLLKATGNMWTVEPKLGTQTLNGVSTGFAVGNGGVIYSLPGRAMENSGVTTALLGTWDTWAVGENGVIIHRVGSSWTTSTSGTTKKLRRVFGTGPTDVWAVGEAGTILHYDGMTWSASPSGVTDYDLLAGAAFSATDAWAVGDDGTVLRWNGTAWSATTSPSPGHLFAISGTGASDVWIAGEAGVALRHHGATWEQVTTGTNPPLYGVWGSGPADVWMLGDGDKAWHWDGAMLGSKPLPDYFLINSVFGSAANDVFAVGVGGAALHWDGTAWTSTTTGVTDDLIGTWSSGPNDHWAIGPAGTAIHHDGTRWTRKPAGTTTDLYGIGGSGSNDVWAVGSGGTVRHFDGTAWSGATSGTTQELYAASSPAPGTTWLAGEATIVKQQGATTFAPVASPGTTEALSGLWADGAADAWAVGTRGTAVHWDGTAWTETWQQTTPFLTTVWSSAPVLGGGGGGAPTITGFREEVPLTLEKPGDEKSIQVPWKDPNGCRPSFCWSACPKNVRCSSGARCTTSLADGLFAGTHRFAVSFAAAPSSTTDELDLSVAPASAPDWSEAGKGLAEGKTVAVGAPVQIPVLIKGQPPMMMMGGGAETWTGTITGSSTTTDFFCTNGIIAHTGTFTINVPSSLTAALALPYNQDNNIRNATGTWSSEAKGMPDCQGGPYSIVTVTPTNVALTVNASPVVRIAGQAAVPEIQLTAKDGTFIVPFLLHQNMTGDDNDVGSEIVELLPKSITETMITGDWKNAGGGSASGNSGKGTFTLTKK